ncbi:DeoR family transcriptional regulator [Leminorella grimontii]|uniref:DeoR family transcriptional regulator n=1 Tax=Leminorella grimontii TaxID=82981 RepID=A0AAV5N3B9_9GAMM|nr:DeoR/GlpR family DNA-binding transcription regulator [Leminorella grimontii]KFC94834.1 DeoR family transcriptional regulator [Leminorella grimontii ATCC 33999 = DSM 5078]GKX56578.1 DeoR family transcriptional regulator [Leminorella grimontii]GKX59821.1 DeoR family transcriptional regulator [Leminorella grimontii]VFS61678.1 Deoxyribose operon repressor [Leminorella grimontii]
MPDVPRYKKILNILDNYDSCSINDLARLLAVSHMSIRRDLKQLQERGLVQLAYGGLVKKRFLDHSPGYDVKEGRCFESKRIIGQRACELLQPDMVVFMDGGTTVREMIPYIQLPITVITLDLSIAMALNSKPEVKLILCPGEVIPRSRACYNSETVRYLSERITDIAFIGADGYSEEYGALTTSQIKADCKWMAIRRSVQPVLLVDESKLNIRCRYKIADLSTFHRVITDGAQPEFSQCAELAHRPLEKKS